MNNLVCAEIPHYFFHSKTSYSPVAAMNMQSSGKTWPRSQDPRDFCSSELEKQGSAPGCRWLSLVCLGEHYRGFHAAWCSSPPEYVNPVSGMWEAFEG